MMTEQVYELYEVVYGATGQHTQYIRNLSRNEMTIYINTRMSSVRQFVVCPVTHSYILHNLFKVEAIFVPVQ